MSRDLVSTVWAPQIYLRGPFDTDGAAVSFLAFLIEDSSYPRAITWEHVRSLPSWCRRSCIGSLVALQDDRENSVVDATVANVALNDRTVPSFSFAFIVCPR